MRRYGRTYTFGARADDSWTYRGIDTAVVENEWLRAVILTGKGGDVCSLSFKPTDTEFMWRTPNGVPGPRFPNAPATGDGDALWFDHYEGGWQSVFPNGGDPSGFAGAPLGLHAESSALPWDCVVSAEGPDYAEVTLTVRLVRTPVTAQRTIGLHAGSPVLRVRETLVNTGTEELPISYGQHITFGAPFLSEHCRIDLPGGEVRTHPINWSPGNRLAAGSRAPWPHAPLVDGTLTRLDTIPAPGSGIEDLAYIDEVKDGWYAVTNREMGVGLAVRYPAELYQHLWYWQVLNGPFRYPWWGQTYNIGLEPFTSATNRGIEAAVQDGSALMLKPQAPLVSELRLSAYCSNAGVVNVDPEGAVSLRDPT